MTEGEWALFLLQRTVKHGQPVNSLGSMLRTQIVQQEMMIKR